jgi:branched-chain amino acid transport system permease protein
MRSKTFRESYREDIKLFHTLWIKGWITALMLFLLSFPLWADPYLIFLANLAGIAVIAAMGLNILTGFTGQISLGHSGFVALGAYTSALLATKTGCPFWLSIPAGGLVASFFGILLGFPCLRLKGLYLAMATMSFGVVIEYVVTHWESLTMGVRGISMPRASLLGISLGNDERFFYVILTFVVILTLAAKNLVRTRVGRAFVAIRDRDIAADVMGVDLTQYKVTSFAISAFYGGIAGGLYSYYMGYLHPENFTILLSIEYIAMIIVGGMGSILGAIFGGIFLTMIPDFMKAFAEYLGKYFVFLQGRYDAEWNIAAFGLLIIIFLIVEPTGLNGIWGRVKRCFKNWPYTY